MGKLILALALGNMVGNTKDCMPALGNMEIRGYMVGNTRDNIMGKMALGNMVIRGCDTAALSNLAHLPFSEANANYVL